MQDVRRVRRESRRLAAIQRWPMHAITVLAFTLLAVLWARDATGQQGGVTLIVLGAWIFVTTLYPKRILRIFLGTKTPMILSMRGGESGLFSLDARQKAVWIAGFVAGVVLGFTASRYTTNEDVPFTVTTAGILGAGIAMTGLAWKRTGLWEFIPVTLLSIVTLATLLHVHDRDTLLWLFLAYGLLYASFLCGSFFLRWRQWVKSLPEIVTTGEV